MCIKKYTMEGNDLKGTLSSKTTRKSLSQTTFRFDSSWKREGKERLDSITLILMTKWLFWTNQDGTTQLNPFRTQEGTFTFLTTLQQTHHMNVCVFVFYLLKIDSEWNSIKSMEIFKLKPSLFEIQIVQLIFHFTSQLNNADFMLKSTF